MNNQPPCDPSYEICPEQKVPPTEKRDDSYWFSDEAHYIGLIFYLLWGITTTSLVVDGVLVYLWEVKAVKDSTVYCPTVASATTIWDSKNCMDSSPTK